MIAIGGALGGILVGLVAPLLFHDFWEYPAALAVCADVVVSIAFAENKGGIYKLRITITAVTLVIVGLFILMRYINYSTAVEVMRDFYGVQRIRLGEYDGVQAYSLVSGSTVHGVQALEGELRDAPTSYYTTDSGAGMALEQNDQRLAGKPLRVGLVGLGTGTLAVYGKEGDLFKFYEIDPNVIQIAQDPRYFTYLKDSKAQIEIVEGDGRLSLERELAEGQPQHFDVLVVDAFSGDSIPTHLISVEAIQIYLKHLAPDGLLVFNISNKYLDLEPVLWRAQETLGLQGAFIQGSSNNALGFPSRWVVLSRQGAFFRRAAVQNSSRALKGKADVRLWTDDYSNLFQVVR